MPIKILTNASPLLLAKSPFSHFLIIIIEIIKYLIELINSKAEIDDIDHLSNRRVRTVGEQLAGQFGVGLARMARTIRERMNVRDNEVFTPIDLINSKTLSKR